MLPPNRRERAAIEAGPANRAPFSEVAMSFTRSHANGGPPSTAGFALFDLTAQQAGLRLRSAPHQTRPNPVGSSR